MNKKTVILKDTSSGKTTELEVIEGTEGNATIDIGTLLKKTGYFTFDPGFVSTASCSSAITYIDGEQGILRYRGYPIEQLAEHSSYLECCYLLLYGELPNHKQMDEFDQIISEHTMVHEALRGFFSGFRRDAHPMAIMVGVVGALSAFYADNNDVHDARLREIAAHRLIAKAPTIAAWSYKHAIGQPFIYPRNELGYAENFLHMMFSVPCCDYEVDPVIARALDVILLLHADHEQNASTSTVRLAGSSGANPFAAIAAGIACLWGPAHGGANEACIRMLEKITEDGDVHRYVQKAKDPNDSFRLMGFGHRVYKNYDPRARIIQQIAHQVLDQLGDHDNPLLKTAMQLEKIALTDDYFVEKKLYPNVDFYSGIILRAIGIPLDMFTVIFAMARTIGWISHWNEMMQQENNKIGRPRQLYIGPKEREYASLDSRN